MGSLDQAQSSNVRRIIKIVNVTGQTPAQIEDTFNNNFGSIGWRIVQVFVIGANTFILAEKQV